ncbi:ADP-ribosylglycohydrolase family protein [Tengunoibacter tsumagoiensis]|uniref:ADP-ribosylglycohydrolase n=1 Tax=Tengunoibacter tsumagoiensis TaxID=2014871 RepID=A0A401ZVP5_9CHLR|nr:ADP-ribosylglycohydrolase family protein [Tengunoibacter tsumagoiensis]GCE10971.1 hypothetical protein KTT_08300 [Tengunoibacter tsumagoiensis]
MIETKDYVERVYAGVLGKIIGVYLGRPFEGWSYERIMEQLGEITTYVHDRLNLPLIVTDDDISGTFTFIRALADYDYSPELTAEQIGQSWLNYIIEKRTILWWGGIGLSTEHTAYLRLKKGIPAPYSGSAALNTQVVAEQIGAQIFIDGWGMIAPGEPELAAALAAKAGSVSHDGEAIYAAQVIAAMEAAAFKEQNIQKLLDIGLSVIPQDALIAHMIQDIRHWYTIDQDWRKTRERIVETYGYTKYGGGCHVIPNHAIIILALLYGENDFSRSLTIANTSGWDTDCNSGNVGCLLGIINGLPGIDSSSYDWRGPVADRMYLPTADGGRTITDAVQETLALVNTARALKGNAALHYKGGARFHFELPGSLQGFQLAGNSNNAHLENTVGHSQSGERSLAIHYTNPSAINDTELSSTSPLEVITATFIQPGNTQMSIYELMASPTLYAGQTVRLAISADEQNDAPVAVQLFIQHYQKDNTLATMAGPVVTLQAGQYEQLSWKIPSTHGTPIAVVGLNIHDTQTAKGTLYLDYLTWDGTPDLELSRSGEVNSMWEQAWVNAVDIFERWIPHHYCIIQNEGRGLLIQGTREWNSYRVNATVSPHLIVKTGLAAHVQGLRRYYALLLTDENSVQLVKVLDGEQILGEVPFQVETDHAYELSMEIIGNRIRAWINGQLQFDLYDTQRPLTSGAIALIIEEGRANFNNISIKPGETH